MAGMSSGKPFSQDYRQPLAPEPRETTELPGDLHSLSWLTTVDVTRLQQTGLYWPDLHTDLEISTMEPQTDQNSLMKRTDEYNPIIPLSERNTDSTWNDAVCRSCHTGNTFYEQHLAINPHRKHFLQQNTTFPKPIYSYSCLIAMALKNSPTCSLTVSEIYRFMSDTFPYFKTAPEGWKNSVRHNLSLNKCFEKVQNKLSSKGYLWVLNPAIHERESRRNRNGNAKISLRTLTDLHSGCSAPDWDQSSHTVLNCSQSNPTWYTPYKDLHGLHIFHSDVPGQADNSDPYLIEFAGNLWEEMKEDSLSPETEDNSKKCLFDSKFVVSEAEPLLLDQLPMGGPYTTYTTIGVPLQNLF